MTTLRVSRAWLLTGVGVVALLVAGVLFPEQPGVPAGIVLRGAVFGVGNGLLAVGLVLTYRTTRIINFGYGAMGGVGGGLAAALTLGKGLPWLVAAVIGVATGVLVGAATERLVIRRFVNAPRLVLTVATIGLAQLLGGLTLFMPGWFGAPEIVPGFDTSLSGTQWSVDPSVFDGNDVLLVAVVPLVLAALVWFLRGTAAGTAVRGMAENMDRARLVGIPVRQLSLLLWSITGGLAALTVVLKAPNEGVSFDAAAGPTILLPALAAAVVTGMRSMPAAFVAGVLIGVADQVVAWNVERRATTYLVLLLIVVIGLLAQPKITNRAQKIGESSWSLTGGGRRLPEALARLPEVRAAKAMLGLIVVAALAIIPLVGSPSQVNRATLALTFGLAALSLVVLTGWGGVVSLGQVALVGVGGVVMANALAGWGIDAFLALVLCALGGGLVALLLGLPALRVSGELLAVTTLAFAVAMQLFILNPANFEWLIPQSYSRPELFGRIDMSDERWVYLLALAVLAVAVFVVGNLRAARTGRTIAATRDNERSAAAAGIDTTRTRMAAFVAAGMFAGVAGGIHAITLRGIGLNTYEAADSLMVFSMAVIGGVGSVGGALGGVALIEWLGYSFPRFQLLLTGVGLLAILMLLPGGLAQFAERLRDRYVSLFAVRHGMQTVEEFAIVDHEGRMGAGTRLPAEITGSGLLAGAAQRHKPLLVCRGVEAGYGPLQVLFGIDTAVADDDMLALLGTNGAGKSTLLKSIVGLLPPSAGKITFDDTDISTMPTEKIARLGISLVPGGKGVFPTLTVEDNLQLACWMLRGDARAMQAAKADVLEMFPILRERWDQMAGDLSGGEQQQLSLAMAFVVRPRLLCIDELSLGLAPTIVAQLVDKVREMHARGTSILVVEQSINVALLLCDRAVFLEKGQVRFRGHTDGLLHQPDILRAVFIGSNQPSGDEPAAVAPAVPIEQRSTRGLTLECRQLTKRFGGIRAVDRVDLVVPPSTIVGLIGHNGAGKTTLFDLLTGFLPADGGTVLLGGQDITRMPPHRRAIAELGRSFQEARLFPSLTVADALRVSLETHLANREPVAAALRLPASTLSERAASRRVDELVELLGLGRYRDTPTGDLSTGTRRIVELGCLLGQDPAVVLLDEPSAGIAQRETEALGPLLRDVQAQTGCSMIVIEHDMALLSSLCDYFVALEQGGVIASGTPDEVLADPLVVSSYLGTNQDVVARSGERRPAHGRSGAYDDLLVATAPSGAGRGGRGFPGGGFPGAGGAGGGFPGAGGAGGVNDPGREWTARNRSAGDDREWTSTRITAWDASPASPPVAPPTPGGGPRAPGAPSPWADGPDDRSRGWGTEPATGGSLPRRPARAPSGSPAGPGDDPWHSPTGSPSDWGPAGAAPPGPGVPDPFGRRPPTTGPVPPAQDRSTDTYPPGRDRTAGGFPPVRDRATGAYPPVGDGTTGAYPPGSDRTTGAYPPVGDGTTGGFRPGRARTTGGVPPVRELSTGGSPPVRDRGRASGRPPADPSGWRPADPSGWPSADPPERAPSDPSGWAPSEPSVWAPPAAPGGSRPAGPAPSGHQAPPSRAGRPPLPRRTPGASPMPPPGPRATDLGVSGRPSSGEVPAMPDRPSMPGRTPPHGQPAHLPDRPVRRPRARPSGETPALPDLGNLPGRTPPGGTPRTSGRLPIVPGPLGPPRTSGQQPSVPGPLGPARPAPGPNGHQPAAGREYEVPPMPPRREQRMGSSWASPDEAEFAGGPPPGQGAAPESRAAANDPFADVWSTAPGDGSWLDDDPDAPEPGGPRRRPPDRDR